MGTIIEQAAVIPFREVADGLIEVALISNRSRQRWIIPKGVIDPGETGPESGARECVEEAGLIGVVETDEPLGHYEYDKWATTCRVSVYPMRVTEELDAWDEDHFRQRRWFSVDEAASHVLEAEVAEMIRSLGGPNGCPTTPSSGE